MIARKYLYLIALARERHFGRAAAACCISPSTLSSAIRDLENELGVVIVERGQQFSGLTPEGVCVLKHAKRMAAESDDLRQELSVLGKGLTGRLRLGVIPTALMPVSSLTAAFYRQNPLVSIELVSLPTSEILLRLPNFELDAGIVYIDSVQDSRQFLTLPLWQETHVLLTPVGGPFSNKEFVTWQEVAEIPLCLLTPDMQSRKTMDEVFAGLGCKAKASLETDSILSMLAHVCSGMWSAILPRSVFDLIGLGDGVRVLQLVNPQVVSTTALVAVRREACSPIVEALVNAVERLSEILSVEAFAKSE